MSTLLTTSITDLRSAKAVILIMQEKDPRMKELKVSEAAWEKIAEELDHLRNRNPRGASRPRRQVMVQMKKHKPKYLLETQITNLRSARVIITALKKAHPHMKAVTVPHSVWRSIYKDVMLLTRSLRNDTSLKLHYNWGTIIQIDRITIRVEG